MYIRRGDEVKQAVLRVASALGQLEDSQRRYDLLSKQDLDELAPVFRRNTIEYDVDSVSIVV